MLFKSKIHAESYHFLIYIKTHSLVVKHWSHKPAIASSNLAVSTNCVRIYRTQLISCISYKFFITMPVANANGNGSNTHIQTSGGKVRSQEENSPEAGLRNQIYITNALAWLTRSCRRTTIGLLLATFV